MSDQVYDHPDYPDGVTAGKLRSMDREDQLDVMRHWFHQNYDQPGNSTPWDPEEGRYIYIWGGPYDAREELEEEFSDVVEESVIRELADDLFDESSEWTKHPEYDEELYAAVASNFAARATFEKAIATIEDLRDDYVGAETPVLIRLLYANVITALETYLSDTFINEVFKKDELLQQFVKTNPDFQKRSLKYSDLFEAAARVREEVKAYLLDVVWHNLPKVQNMYDAVLGVKLGPAFEDVAKAIAVRHDIIHRNGVTKDGKLIELTATDLNALIAKTTELADYVEAQMPADEDDDDGGDDKTEHPF